MSKKYLNRFLEGQPLLYDDEINRLVDKDICPLCGGKVRVGRDNRCNLCGEVIDEPVGEEDDA